MYTLHVKLNLCCDVTEILFMLTRSRPDLYTLAMLLRLKTEEIARLQVIRKLPTQLSLAKRAGLSKQHLSKVLGGQVITTATLGRLCAALDCEPGDILGRASGTAGETPV